MLQRADQLSIINFLWGYIRENCFPRLGKMTDAVLWSSSSVVSIASRSRLIPSRLRPRRFVRFLIYKAFKTRGIWFGGIKNVNSIYSDGSVCRFSTQSSSGSSEKTSTVSYCGRNRRYAFGITIYNESCSLRCIFKAFSPCTAACNEATRAPERTNRWASCSLTSDRQCPNITLQLLYIHTYVHTYI